MRISPVQPIPWHQVYCLGTLNTVEITAIAPNTDSVVVHSRRYSTSPPPITRGERIRKITREAAACDDQRRDECVVDGGVSGEPAVRHTAKSCSLRKRYRSSTSMYGCAAAIRSVSGMTGMAARSAR
jgi:hypothetical protein